MNKPSDQRVDAALVGGGIAGAWLYRLLSDRGYEVILLERDKLGCDQTLASQGMIHGGIKYVLGGKLTGASEAIASMPERWRDCLSGDGDIDLQGLPLLSDRYYMFAASGGLGKLTGFFASKMLRGRIEKLSRGDWPEAFEGFDGVVYALNDFVIDTHALLSQLTGIKPDNVFQAELSAENVTPAEDGFVIRLADTTIHAGHLISCAGNGSAGLLAALGISGFEVQQRPLKQVVVHAEHEAQLFAHCLTGVTRNEPRLTITTHQGATGSVYYLGGQLATGGVERSDDEQIELARRELETCVPWLTWNNARFETLFVNRAEPLQRESRRPDEAYAERHGRFIQAFPTKLSLAPDLGEQVLKLLPPPGGYAPAVSDHPRAQVGQSPW